MKDFFFCFRFNTFWNARWRVIKYLLQMRFCHPVAADVLFWMIIWTPSTIWQRLSYEYCFQGSTKKATVSHKRFFHYLKRDAGNNSSFSGRRPTNIRCYSFQSALHVLYKRHVERRDWKTDADFIIRSRSFSLRIRCHFDDSQGQYLNNAWKEVLILLNLGAVTGTWTLEKFQYY